MVVASVRRHQKNKGVIEEDALRQMCGSAASPAIRSA
jgi:hypothetical protein